MFLKYEPGQSCTIRVNNEGEIHYNYEPRVAVVLKHCQGCMRVHVCVGFVMGRL